ncbi:MAG: EamA family transporter [Granulosicoccus sp.]
MAVLTIASGSTPPFQLMAVSLAIGGMLGIVICLFRRQGFSALRQPALVWLLGVTGLFGYHFAYFTALRNAPPVEAGLIAYLWPLFIVLLSTLLPEERLRWFHLAGGALGLAGAALLVSGGNGFNFQQAHVFGYTMAFLCALIWSAYSVLSRRFDNVPSEIVTGFCLVSALLAWVAHLALEETLWPVSPVEWLAVVGLGLGPIGLAFYVWDYGVKHGDIQVLGAVSYLAPLLSTLALIYAGYATFSLSIVIACLLIMGGAILASKELLTQIFQAHSSKP